MDGRRLDAVTVGPRVRTSTRMQFLGDPPPWVLAGVLLGLVVLGLRATITKRIGVLGGSRRSSSGWSTGVPDSGGGGRSWSA